MGYIGYTYRTTTMVNITGIKKTMGNFTTEELNGIADFCSHTQPTKRSRISLGRAITSNWDNINTIQGIHLATAWNACMF